MDMSLLPSRCGSSVILDDSDYLTSFGDWRELPGAYNVFASQVPPVEFGLVSL